MKMLFLTPSYNVMRLIAKEQKTMPQPKYIVIVVVVFPSCYFVELYSVVGKLGFSSPPSKEVISFLIPVNSTANPIACALFKRDIRKEP